MNGWVWRRKLRHQSAHLQRRPCIAWRGGTQQTACSALAFLALSQLFARRASRTSQAELSEIARRPAPESASRTVLQPAPRTTVLRSSAAAPLPAAASSAAQLGSSSANANILRGRRWTVWRATADVASHQKPKPRCKAAPGCHSSST
jgi:hypothetical protein